MEIPISTGQWMNAMNQRMSQACDGDVFLLPSFIHLHAFRLVKDSHYPGKQFKVKVSP
jgi:hypothetical protein